MQNFMPVIFVTILFLRFSAQNRDTRHFPNRRRARTLAKSPKMGTATMCTKAAELSRIFDMTGVQKTQNFTLNKTVAIKFFMKTSRFGDIRLLLMAGCVCICQAGYVYSTKLCPIFINLCEIRARPRFGKLRVSPFWSKNRKNNMVTKMTGIKFCIFWTQGTCKYCPDPASIVTQTRVFIF